jgi:hypothetical protein
MVLIICTSCTTSNKLVFNSEDWKINNEFSSKIIRYKMIDNIIKTKLLIGKTLYEVINILGDYDFIFDNNHIRYTLGTNPDSIISLLKGFSVLDIELENNIVISVKKNSEFNYIKKIFNKSDWELFVESRFTMSENIIKSKLLIGKTMDEVIELLGDKECIIREDIGYIEFYLGFVPRLFAIDPHVLGLIFENGKVIKVVQRET